MQEISKVLAEKFDEVTEKINVFSDEYLNQEYKSLCNKGAKELFLNCESNVKKGKSTSWAAGIVHAIGSVNNLFDSKEEPYIKALDLYKSFGVSSSTGASKSKEVKSLLNISTENNEWIISGKVIEKEATAEMEAALTVDAIEKEEDSKFTISKSYVESQKIVNLAWNEKNYRNKTKYAYEALELCEDCADAYIILSNNTSLKTEERLELLRKAVKAGSNILKIDSLETADKRVLALPVAEPFFGAKYFLANYLYEIGRKDEAIKEAMDILNYSEEDSMLAIEVVISWLIIEKRYDEAKEIIDRYESSNLAVINYNRAALYFMTGNLKNAESALRRAYIRNPYVVEYLLKRRNVKTALKNTNDLNREREAIHYSELGLKVWNTPEIKQWLKDKKSDFDILRL